MNLTTVLMIFVVAITQLVVGIRYDRTPAMCDRNRAPNNTFYRLPKTVTPLKYRLKFRTDVNPYKFHAAEQIQVLINNRTDIIELNSVDLRIESVWFKTRRLRVEVKTIHHCIDKETIILQFYKPLDKGVGNLTINFSGNINSWVTGFFRGHPTTEDEGYIAVTDFGPSDSRRAFPNWDEPSFKAQIELTMFSPKNHHVLSNMVERRRRETNPDTDEVRFDVSPPMASCLVALILGKFDYLEKLTEDEEVLVRVFTPINRQDEGMYALDVTSKLLMFYKFYFNTSYPLAKLDLVSIPDYPSSMETWGLITFTEKQILVSNETTEEEKRTVTAVIAHALAHQWIGNLVTIDSWNDMWIIEGFATFVENEAIDILFPSWRVWHNFVAKDAQMALDADSLQSAQPIEPRIDFPTQIQEKFTSVSYQKSAAVMRMLNRWVGKEPFRRGIQKVLFKHSFQTITALDFWKAFHDSKDLVEVADNWAEQKGIPVITVKERHNGTERILTLTQDRFLTIDKSGSNSSQLWKIPVKVTNQFSPYTPCSQMLMKTKEVEVVVKEVLEWEWVKLNHNFNGFFRVNYPVEMLDKFVHSIEERSMSSLDRLNILSDLFAMIQSGRVSTDVGLKFMLHYRNETNYAIWNYIVKTVQKLDLLFSDTDIRENFWSYGRTLLSRVWERIGFEAKLNEDLRITKLRPKVIDLLATFNYKKVISDGLRKYEEYKNGNSNATKDIVISLYKIIGQNCEEHTFDEFFEQYKTGGNPIIRNHMITALTSTSKKERVLKVLEFSISENIRFTDSAKIISGLCHSMIGRDKTWKFFEQHYYEFQSMFGSSTVEMNNLIKNFVEKFSSEDKANEFETFFGPRSVSGTIDKSIQTALERVRIHAKWLNRDIIQIREYFTKNSFESKII